MTAPLDPARLDEIEAAVPAIAPGPWRLERDNALGEWVIWTDADDPILQVLIWGSDLGPFIESVPTVIPELLAEIRRLRGENEQLADLDAAATRRSELRAERDRAVTRWHEEHKRAERLAAEVDRFHDTLAGNRLAHMLAAVRMIATESVTADADLLRQAILDQLPPCAIAGQSETTGGAA